MKLFDGWTEEEKKEWCLKAAADEDGCDITVAPPKFFLSIRYIVSIFAMWAIRQSPYVVPDRLSSACEHFHERLREVFKDNILESYDSDWLENLSREQLFQGIKEIIMDENFVQTKAWNTKVQHSPMNEEDMLRSQKKCPDNDFIDISALSRNVAMDIWKEGCLQEKANEEIAKSTSPGYATICQSLPTTK